MVRVSRTSVAIGIVVGLTAAGVALRAAPGAGSAGVEVIGPLERVVEVEATGEGARRVELWLRAEVRELSVLQRYGERVSAVVKIGGDVTGLDAASVNRAVEEMVREESGAHPALARVVVPRIERGAFEGEAGERRLEWGGVAANVGGLAGIGLGFGMLAFGVMEVGRRVRARA